VPTKPTTLPIWATNAGSNVVTGLAIDNINWQTGTVSTVRYTFTGSPDLSAVIVGHQLVASGCTDGTHNGTFEITAVNNASDWIEVVNAAVTDATLDEASSPGTAIVKTGSSLIQAPTSSKQNMGWLNDERPPAGYFNWQSYWVYQWIDWLDQGGGGVESYATKAALRAVDTGSVSVWAFVVDFGMYYFDSTSTLTDDDEIVLEPDAGTGRWILSLPHPDLIYTYTEAQTGANGDLVATFSQVSTINPASVSANTTSDETVTVTGAAVGDEVHITPPATLDTGLSVSGFVSATNTVKVRFANCTGGPINPGSADYRITVRQYQS
jgi:hypothetical protein